MTTTQVAHIIALVDEAISRAFERNLAGAIRLKTEVEAALRDAPQQAIPAGTRVVDRGFRFDGEKQEHIPQLVIEFEPVPVNSEYGAKGWKDRDYVAAMLTTCDCPAKDMPFGRCCKVTPSAPTAVEPDAPLKWCSYCGEGVTTFCRGKQSPDWDYKCPVLNLPARASKGTP